MYHILLKERERPSDEMVCSRLTDEWWNLCLSCWHHDPLLRPSMSGLVENIRALQVCCEASNPKNLTDNIRLYLKLSPARFLLRCIPYFCD